MPSGAVLAFEDRCRLLLSRGEGDRTAVWLMCNPSTADAVADDPTIRRCLRFSAGANCDRLLVVNLWAWRATHPAALWGVLDRGDYTADMHAANMATFLMVGAQADVIFVAFGAGPWRRHRAVVDEALVALLAAAPDEVVPHCLGLTQDGAPLHPLARGKLAVRDDAQPFEWPYPY